jgi:hypothetical protein
MVEATELTTQREMQVFGELIAKTAQLVDSYSDAHLEVIKDFLERSGGLVAAHGDRLAEAIHVAGHA